MKNEPPAAADLDSQRSLNIGLASRDLRYTSGPAASMASASYTRLRAYTTASIAALAAAWLLHRQHQLQQPLGFQGKQLARQPA
jgi:hypothetical protein